GEGSTFTLYLPRNYMPARSAVSPRSAKAPKAISEIQAAWTPAESVNRDVFGLNGNEASPIADDRNAIEEGDRPVLIVEDDIPFANILLDLAREKGFKGLVATTGQMALALANKFS
ncbi:MAG TPA: hypothetical protein DC054_03940, partial [Blastocatellia bacterium]|nr:hypothetical protein [Blastocatellia bacterium]